MTRWLPFLCACTVVEILACGSSDSPTGGTGGGSTSGGGTDGSGGAPTGGTADSGGSSGNANGGVATTGGAANSGGKASGGSGGATTGGAANSGGSAGKASGGSAGSADVCRGTKATGYVADGLCAVQIGTVNNARQIAFSSNGDLWVTSSNGQIRRLRDTNGNGTFETAEIVVWATTGGNGQNSHIDEAGGYLYSGSTSGVKRFAWSTTLDMGGAGEDVMTGQPGSGGHPKHTVHVWDGYMYVMSGSSGNVSNENTNKAEYNTQRSVIKRFPLASFQSGTPLTWDSGEIFVRGIRNVLGFNRDAMGRMFGVQNGQDDVRYGGADVHTDNPGEALLRLDMASAHGYPFCYAAQQVTGIEPGTQVASEIYANNTHDDAWCQTNAVKPTTFMQAHSAPMDIAFFTGTSTALPSRWLHGAFVSLHGSWNRNPGSGKKVVWVPFNADGTSPMPMISASAIGFPYEVVFGESGDKIASGAGQTSNGGFRPVGLAISPVDGALYISSDGNGGIYRVGLLP